jgi:integrase/recombinase XerC
MHAVVAAAGKRVGVKLRPHGLRHCAVGRALDLTNGNVRDVQQFARHSKPEVTMRYDDQRRARASVVAQLVGG